LGTEIGMVRGPGRLCARQLCLLLPVCLPACLPACLPPTTTRPCGACPSPGAAATARRCIPAPLARCPSLCAS
jgi:hypothetical protein